MQNYITGRFNHELRAAVSHHRFESTSQSGIPNSITGSQDTVWHHATGSSMAHYALPMETEADRCHSALID